MGPQDAESAVTALHRHAGADRFSSLVTLCGGGCLLFTCVSTCKALSITMTTWKFFPVRQNDVKCCYRTWLRECSGKIKAVRKLVVFSLE